jgi:predicted MFS family arabinose efflux permease
MGSSASREREAVFVEVPRVSPNTPQRSERDHRAREYAQFVLSSAYCLAMGVCGLVLVSIGLTLSDLSTRIGLDSAEQLGTVFISRGIGAVVGSLVSARLYHEFSGNLVLATSLGGLALTTLVMPHNRSFLGIQFLFLCLGLGTSITDTGCQILTRKLHGEKAGPWLGLNTVAFGLSGALVPLISLVAHDIFTCFGILTLIIVVVCLSVLACPDPASATGEDLPACISTNSLEDTQTAAFSAAARANRKKGRVSLWTSEGTMAIYSPVSNKEGQVEGDMSSRYSSKGDLVLTEADAVTPPHFYVEGAISIMVFCLIGGKVCLTAYLESYVKQTGVIEASSEHSLLLLFWICVTAGRMLGIYLSSTFTNSTVPVHIGAASTVGSLAGALVLFFPASPGIFWFGLCLYGFCTGPCLGYCYDLNNRLTYPTETSQAIVMAGLNAGASLVPFLCSILWQRFSAEVLIWVVALSMLVPLPMLYFALHSAYDKKSRLPAPVLYESINET